MNIETKDDIVIINLNSFSNDISRKLNELVSNYENKNVIVNLNYLLSVERQPVDLLTKLSMIHKENKQSFIIISQSLSIENEQLDIVPTLQEAYDYIEMENIERDLGIDF